MLTQVSVLDGFKSLWDVSIGTSEICVAVLDGPVVRSHPCFEGSNLTQLSTLVPNVANTGPASQHGTHITSILFGQHHSSVRGIVPGCRGLIVPVFSEGRGGGLVPCSQIDLARAITQAVEHGAQVINISGGQLAASAEADILLVNAIRLCQENNVLIVAAAGNNGCECLHIPAALESVLAVGAMDMQGNPIESSNWGKTYQNQGILALGENILGANLGGGTALKSGTSFAAPMVSGVAALLLSIQQQRGGNPDPHAIRDILLKSALPCNQLEEADNGRCLVGRLNIAGAYTLVTHRGVRPLSEAASGEENIQVSEAEYRNLESSDQGIVIDILQPSKPTSPIAIGVGVQAAEAKTLTTIPSVTPLGEIPNVVALSKPSTAVSPSECTTCGGGGSIQMVYALGELGYDFGSRARLDSFIQSIFPSNPPRSIPDEILLGYLAENPYYAQSLIWTVELDATPIYAIVPSGPFAGVVYERLREFISDGDVERVSIPGYVGGSVRLMSGEVIPAIIPEVRGIYSWSVEALLDAVIEPSTPEENREDLRTKIREVLDRIYYDFRNLGITPQERALNYAATNAFQISVAISQQTLNDRVIETIEVVKSPICRPESDCYDVKLRFFDPDNLNHSRKVTRFTIDVSDVIPVSIGRMRSWSEA